MWWWSCSRQEQRRAPALAPNLCLLAANVQDLATAICGGEPSANAAAFFTAVSSGGGKAALAAVLAAAQDDLPDCEDAADVLYAAAIDSFRLLQVAGNDTEAATA